MALIVKDDGQGDFEKAPTGVNAAVCCGVYDIGIQTGGNYGDKHQAIVCFELEGTEGGRVCLSKFYNLSFAPKSNLRKDLQSWRGKAYSEEEAQQGIDLEKLFGRACGITVMDEKKGDKEIQRITSISQLPKGMPTLQPTLTEMPEWIKKKIDEQLQNSDVPDWNQDSASFGDGRDLDTPF